MKYIVRWQDKGKENRKEYLDYSTALKAKKWLIAQGIKDVDIAVSK